MQLPVSQFARHQRIQWLLIALLLAALGVVVAALVAYEHRRTLQREGELMQLQVRVIDENLGQQLQGMDAAIISVRGDMASLQAQGLGKVGSLRLKALTDAMPGVRTMAVTDARGIVLASNRSDAVGLDVSQRPYFRAAQAQPSLERLYVSEPFETVFKVYSLNVVKIWTDEQGRFAGIISATLDPDYFKVLLHSVLYAPDMRSIAMHGNGLVLLSAPALDPFQGVSLSVPGSFFTRHMASGRQASLLMGRTVFTGEDRMAVYRTVQPAALHMDKPLVLSVSRMRAAVLAPWRKLAWLYGLTYMLVALVAGASTFMLQRQQKALVRLTLLREQELYEYAEKIDLALAGADLGLWEMDLGTGQGWANARAYDMLGQPPDTPIGSLEQWLRRVHPEDRQMVHDALTRRLQQGDAAAPFAIDYRMQHQSGQWIWLHSRGKPTRWDDEGAPLHVIGTYLDITQRKNAEAQVAELAFHDPLTRLPNRRLLLDRLEQVRRASVRTGAGAALLFLDLDRFKWINDTQGHEAGDRLLQKVAGRLQASVRQSDTVARLGGDEFVLLVHPLAGSAEQVRAGALAVADTVLAAMRQPVELDTVQHTVTTSIGVALFGANSEPAEQILKRADQAMYKAKAAGRNQVHIEAAP